LKGYVMTIADIETRLQAVEEEVAALRDALEVERVREGIRIGLEQVARGQVRPAREALEELRRTKFSGPPLPAPGENHPRRV
jgi:ribosome biogenesis protein Nip4